jgi:hypothetical protein
VSFAEEAFTGWQRLALWMTPQEFQAWSSIDKSICQMMID